MKDTGIIMSGNHPKLILDGRKTQTRRVIKLPKWMLPYEPKLNEAYVDGGVFASGAYLKVPLTKGDMAGTVQRVFCPYGYPYSKDSVVWDKPTISKPGIKMYAAKDARPMRPDEGDRLWVREAFAKRTDGVDQILFKSDYESINKMLELDEFAERMGYPVLSIKWKPSIHLFKKDARIWLEITEVRVERVQAITDQGCLKEGCESALWVDEKGWHTPLTWFQDLWDSLNAKRGYGWKVNPWVWVISFKKC